MKNVKDYQLKKCIFMETEEFDRIIKTVFGNNYEAEFSLEGIDVSSDEDGLTCEEINEGLSKYFDVEVTFTHIDDCDNIGVWICYKEKFKNNSLTEYEKLKWGEENGASTIEIALLDEFKQIPKDRFYHGVACSIPNTNFIRVFYGSDNGVDDKIVTINFFNKNFKVTNIIFG